MPKFGKSLERTEITKDILSKFKEVSSEANAKILLLYGGGGNGKSTIVSSILFATDEEDKNDFFVKECNIQTVMWLNCYQWNRVMNKADFELAIVNEAMRLVPQKDQDSIKSLPKMINYCHPWI